MEERSGTQGRRPTTGTGGNRPFRETEGRSGRAEGHGIAGHRQGGSPNAGKPGESRGDPAQSPGPLLVFPRVKLDPYLLLASGRANVGERMGWRAQGREK